MDLRIKDKVYLVTGGGSGIGGGISVALPVRARFR